MLALCNQSKDNKGRDMWYDEENGKLEKYGTCPVSNAYWMFVEKQDALQYLPESFDMIEEDKKIREIIISSAIINFDEIPLEESEAIAIDMSGEEPIYSKGWKKFFKWEI
jgi:hypothetical protein